MRHLMQHACKIINAEQPQSHEAPQASFKSVLSYILRQPFLNLICHDTDEDSAYETGNEQHRKIGHEPDV